MSGSRRVRGLHRVSVAGLVVVVGAAAGLSFAAGAGAGAPRAVASGLTTTTTPGAGLRAAPAAAPALGFSAVRLFSNFGPGNAYNCCVGGTIGGPGSPVGFITQANQFTPSRNGLVVQIDVALGHVTGSNSATIELAADNGGVPGAVLRSWSVSGQPAFGTCCTVTTVQSYPPISVFAGTTYWVIASAASDTWDAWNWNSIGQVGNVAFDTGSGWTVVSGATTYAFDVLGCKLCKVT
jgi:hypothetical protein